MCLGGADAGRNRGGQPVEVSSPDIAKIGHEQNVLRTKCRDLRLGVSPGQEAGQLRGDGQEAVCDVFFAQRCADIDRDNDIGAHLAHCLDRQVTGYTAIDKIAVSPRDRGHDRWNRHAGTDRLWQVAGIKHHFFTSPDIRGDGTKRNREVIELVDIGYREWQPDQKLVDLLPLPETRWDIDLSIINSSFALDQS